MKSIREKFIFCAVAVVTVVSGVVFAGTFVKAAIYDGGVTGIQETLAAQGAEVQGAGTQGLQTATSSSLHSATVVSATAPVGEPPEYPSRLMIPSLSINAHVQELGINPKGNIGVPNNFTDVGWYSYGTVPGESGTAIIDGHVDNGLGLAGVFKHLLNIQNGDDVDVVTYSGTTLHFVVTDIQVYYYKDVPPEAIFGSGNSSGSSLLKLITCDGTWVQGGDTYNERLIVTATLET